MVTLDGTLDQMVDCLVDYNELPFLELVQMTWRKGWLLESALEPVNDSAFRQALKACLLERMVEIWNAPPKNECQVVPAWCARVPPLQTAWSVIKPEDRNFWQNEPANPIFSKRNIYAPESFMFFL